MLISKFGTKSRTEIRSALPLLPDGPVSFLEKYNGGETPETSFDLNGVSSDIVAFYGIGDVKYSFRNVSLQEVDGVKYLPIAFDSFGNHIAVLPGEESIYFLDHEKAGNPIRIADSFAAFIAQVKSTPLNPNHTKSIQEREQALIDRSRGHIITDELRNMWQKEIDKYSQIHQEEVLLGKA